MIKSTYYTAYNEIDERIYDGTPLFDNRKDAEDWLGGQPFICRPSTKIAQVQIVLEETIPKPKNSDSYD